MKHFLTGQVSRGICSHEATKLLGGDFTNREKFASVADKIGKTRHLPDIISVSSLDRSTLSTGVVNTFAVHAAHNLPALIAETEYQEKACNAAIPYVICNMLCLRHFVEEAPFAVQERTSVQSGIDAQQHLFHSLPSTNLEIHREPSGQKCGLCGRDGRVRFEMARMKRNESKGKLISDTWFCIGVHDKSSLDNIPDLKHVVAVMPTNKFTVNELSRILWAENMHFWMTAGRFVLESSMQACREQGFDVSAFDSLREVPPNGRGHIMTVNVYGPE